MSHQHTLLFLVSPQQEDSEGEAIGGTTNAEELTQRLDEFQRLKRVLLELGFHLTEGRDKSITVRCKGSGWESKGKALPLFISDANITVLEGKVQRLIRTRAKALVKLTPEEQEALGLLHRKVNPVVVVDEV